MHPAIFSGQGEGERGRGGEEKPRRCTAEINLAKHNAIPAVQRRDF